MTKATQTLDFDTDWEYSPAPESTDHIQIRSQYDLFINGDFTAPVKDNYFDTINPADESSLSSVGHANEKDVDKAVTSAKKALKGAWSKMSGAERGKYIFRIARLIQEKAREFSVIESMDGGKPIRESRDVDIPLVSAHFFYYAGWADKLEYAFPGKKAVPVGEYGCIETCRNDAADSHETG